MTLENEEGTRSFIKGKHINLSCLVFSINYVLDVVQLDLQITQKQQPKLPEETYYC